MNRLLFLIAALGSLGASAHPHLLEAGSWPGFTLADYYDDQSRALRRMTREQLEEELDRLKAEQPSPLSGLGPAITGGCLLGLGAAGFVYGLNMVNTAASYNNVDNQFFGTLLTVAGAAAGITGAVLLIVGVVKLIVSHFRYESSEEAIAGVNQRLKEVEQAPRPAPPAPVPQLIPLPPEVPPPPPFPDSELIRPLAPPVTLASF